MVQSRATKRWLIIIASLLVIAAVTAGIWLRRGTDRSSLAGRPVPTPDFDSTAAPTGNSSPTTISRPGDVTITLPPDKLENAHLKIEEVVARPVAALEIGGLRTTGTVQSNAYKEVPVLPVAGGIVREVNVVLGEQVMHGQKIAAIFSTELSEAQTSYLGLQAEIEKHHQHYHRAEQLVEIGAVSREEFEAAQAEYKTEQAKLAAARQRLQFLGLSAKQVEELRAPDQMSALISVDAPVTGTVLSRTVNVGEIVMTGKQTFRSAGRY